MQYHVEARRSNQALGQLTTFVEITDFCSFSSARNSFTGHSIMKFTKYITATALLLLSASPSLAHEMRHIGGANGDGKGANVFMFHVGFGVEPAYEDVVNAIDINLSFHPDEAHSDALTEPVDTEKGDVVFIKEAEVLLLESEARPARVLRRTLLPVPRDEKGNIQKKFGTENKYLVHFRPTVDGAYGFRLKGYAQHKGRTVGFEETFICGAGTKDIDVTTGLPISKFNCVTDAVAFPGNNSERDVRGYQDNDRVPTP